MRRLRNPPHDGDRAQKHSKTISLRCGSEYYGGIFGRVVFVITHHHETCADGLLPFIGPLMALDKSGSAVPADSLGN